MPINLAEAENESEPSNGPVPILNSSKRESFGKAAGSGFSWLSLSLASGKLLNFLTQIVLGSLLLDSDFGVLAIVATIATFIRVFNDGGVSQVLIQRGADQFDQIARTAFWIGIGFSIFTGLILVITAPLVAWMYSAPQLMSMLLLIALTMPLSGISAVHKAKLRLDLRFQALAWTSIGWFLVRYLGAIWLAYKGFGVMSFIIPLPLASLLESVTIIALTKVNFVKAKHQLSQWYDILRDSLWVAIAAFFRGFARNGDYLILGLLLSKALLGQYYFGYQLTVQFSILIATNIQHVLFPVMSRLAANPERQTKAILRTIQLMILVAAPFSMVLAANIESLEELIWNKKWLMAVPVMQIFAIAAPLRLLPDIVHAVLASHGRFRMSAWLIFAEGVLLMISAWIAAILWKSDLTMLALVVASSQVAFALFMSGIFLNKYGISPSAFLAACLPTWLASLVSVGLTLIISKMCMTLLAPWLRMSFETCLFGLIFFLLTRLFYPGFLADLVNVAPRPMDSLLSKAFFVKPTRIKEQHS